MSELAISFKDVCFSYKDIPVVEHFSLDIYKGDRICLFGKSGCGKTTILRLICGLEKPDSGSLYVYSQNIRPVFQEDRLLPFKTAKQNVAMFADADQASIILESLGLSEAANEYPKQLSGGMARRAAIARAVAGDGDIYLFDEPFNGLDEHNIGKASALINERTAGKTVVSVLHNQSDAARIDCRIVEI